jgi:hypothetical protein
MQLRAVTHGEAEITGPVIILCPPRSLSSVISQALGQHPQLHALAENGLLIAPDMESWRARYEGHPHFWPGALRTIAHAMYGALDAKALARADEYLHSATRPEDVFSDIEQALAPHIVIDKSPLVMPIVGDLDRMVRRRPHARFLHLVRHPYTSVRSMIRQATWRAGEMPVMAPLMWWSAHRSSLALAASLPEGRVQRVRAEDVAADPLGSLGRALDAWGFRTDAAALAGLISPERSPHASRPDLGGNAPDFLASPGWRELPAPPDDLLPPEAVSSAALDAAIAEMAAAFGYDVTPRR